MWRTSHRFFQSPPSGPLHTRHTPQVVKVPLSWGPTLVETRLLGSARLSNKVPRRNRICVWRFEATARDSTLEVLCCEKVIGKLRCPRTGREAQGPRKKVGTTLVPCSMCQLPRAQGSHLAWSVFSDAPRLSLIGHNIGWYADPPSSEDKLMVL